MPWFGSCSASTPASTSGMEVGGASVLATATRPNRWASTIERRSTPGRGWAATASAGGDAVSAVRPRLRVTITPASIARQASRTDVAKRGPCCASTACRPPAEPKSLIQVVALMRKNELPLRDLRQTSYGVEIAALNYLFRLDSGSCDPLRAGRCRTAAEDL
jgi:hypothetical protein